MGRSRLPLAIVVAAAAAAGATFLLRPRTGLIEPVPVDAEAYFTAFQLDRAEDFRGVQRMLGLASLGVSVGTLAVLAWRPPRRLLERLGLRPLLGGAAAGAGISLVLVLTGLPLSAWMRSRAIDVGLATQSWSDWALDVLKSAGIEAAVAAAGGFVAMVLVRRFRRNWWAPAAVVVAAFGVITIWLYPVVIDPVFNDFEKLPPGQVRSDVLELAEEAGVDIGEVYRVDASRRTSAANAYVNGLGHSKRVVLYDNLIAGFPRDEVRLVVAHELGHQKHDDLLRGLAWLALVAIALAVTLTSLALGAASNVLSRQVESRADAFSLDLTQDPAAFVQFERRIALRNISDPDPPGLLHALFATHPTTLERIGFGEAWEKPE
jgi:STE24 endopeptidase